MAVPASVNRKWANQWAKGLLTPGRPLLSSLNLPTGEAERLYQQGLAAPKAIAMGQFPTAGAALAHNAGFFAAQQPTMPPPGSYDPTIDVQLGQAQRGYGDLGTDYTKDWGELGTALGGRQGTDFKTARDRLGIQGGWQNSDFDQQKTRLGEDYGRSIGDLTRQYGRLGNNQRQAAAAAGVAGGGALAQALRKRTENMAYDRQPIDQAFSRGNTDIDTNRSRFNEQQGWQTTDLTNTYTRGNEDALTALGRAGRETTQFGIDASKLANYSAGVDTPAGGATLAQLLGPGSGKLNTVASNGVDVSGLKITGKGVFRKVNGKWVKV